MKVVAAEAKAKAGTVPPEAPATAAWRGEPNAHQRDMIRHGS